MCVCAGCRDKADMRKDWLTSYDPSLSVDSRAASATLGLDTFINQELIEFSIADNVRSIPSLVDGLKPGQRKILWSCFKRNLVQEIKVAQLGGFVSEHASYHHGEASLYDTIIHMAADFTGGNNLNMLFPSGQFGTRHLGGKDSASARYIFTRLTRMARLVYHPHDDPLLAYRDDDGLIVEPAHYVPVLPMALINGARGVGTGFSTRIPSFNPSDLIERLQAVLRGDLDPAQATSGMLPWVRGFTGSIRKVDSTAYLTQGAATATPLYRGKRAGKVTGVCVEVEELPVDKWTQKYKDWLSDAIKAKDLGTAELKHVQLKRFTQHHSNERIHFKLYLEGEGSKDLLKMSADELCAAFRLTSRINLSNMHLFDAQGRIAKFDSVAGIFEAFYHVRRDLYGKRKAFLTKKIEQELLGLSERVRFVELVVSGGIVLSNKSRADILAQMTEHKFRPKRAHELLKLPLTALTSEEIGKLNMEHSKKELELQAIQGQTPEDLWTDDLRAIQKELDTHGMYQM
jgi:DNA topoisomerase-2